MSLVSWQAANDEKTTPTGNDISNTRLFNMSFVLTLLTDGHFPAAASGTCIPERGQRHNDQFHHDQAGDERLVLSHFLSNEPEREIGQWRVDQDCQWDSQKQGRECHDQWVSRKEDFHHENSGESCKE